MEAMENVTLIRSQGDTDDIIFILETRSENGLQFVTDASVVTLHVKSNPIKSVVGLAKGDNSGTFYFDPTTFADLAGTFLYEIEVNDGTHVYTIARGYMICTPEIV